MKQTICVIGEGAWGTAIASILAHNGYSVCVWCQDPQIMADINIRHENTRYIPGVVLNESIHATDNIKQAVQNTTFVFCSTPVLYLRAVLEHARGAYDKNQTWVMLNKGIEQKTHMYATQIIDDVFATKVPAVFLGGPSFARDVICNEVTAVVLASIDEQRMTSVRTVLENDYFKPYTSSDVVGVQICAAFKNVVAIGVGILSGAGYGDNTKAFFLTRALAEIENLTLAMGGTQATVMGLAGVGDVVLTGYSAQGRNVEIGTCIGEGEDIKSLRTRLAVLPEGMNTIFSIAYFAEHYNCAMPLHQALYRVVVDGQPVQELVDTLMSS